MTAIMAARQPASLSTLEMELADNHEKIFESRAGALHGRDAGQLHATSCRAGGN